MVKEINNFLHGLQLRMTDDIEAIPTHEDGDNEEEQLTVEMFKACRDPGMESG